MRLSVPERVTELHSEHGLQSRRLSVWPAMTRIAKGTCVLAATPAIMLIAERPAAAKVAPATLAEMVRRADFVGIVRIDRVTKRIPLLRRRRASGTILQSWKGRRSGAVSSVAQATWICDISEAKKGELALIFLEGDRLLLAGRGRMPIFTREGRRFAACGRMFAFPLTSGPRTVRIPNMASSAALPSTIWPQR